MSNALWVETVRSGPLTSRPTVPDLPALTFAFFYDETNNIMYAWLEGAWVDVSVLFSGSAPVAVGAAATAVLGNTYLLGTASGSVLTLPPATGSGKKIKAVVSLTATSGAHKILTSPITDVLIGRAVGAVVAGTPLQFSAITGDGFHSIQMPFAGTQPSGGFEGDIFEFTDVAAGKWEVVGHYKSGTTSTTPFSTATT